MTRIKLKDREAELSDFQSKILSRLKAIFEIKNDDGLGDMFGVEKGSISSYRKGKRDIPLYKLFKVIDNANLSYDFVMRGDLSKVKSSEDLGANEKEELIKARQLIKMLMSVKKDQQGIIAKQQDMIDFIVSKDEKPDDKLT